MIKSAYKLFKSRLPLRQKCINIQKICKIYRVYTFYANIAKFLRKNIHVKKGFYFKNLFA